MRSIVAVVLAVSLAVVPTLARADKCYVDSECPTGYECDGNGACVPAYKGSSGGSSEGGGPNPLMLVLGAALIVGVVVFILLPSMQATEDATRMKSPALGKAPFSGGGLAVSF